MKSPFLICLLLLSPLIGRENPFFAADPSAQKVTSNIPDAAPQFETLSYTFPDHARLLKEITFTIQNADGTIEKRKVEVDKTIDWHRPILMTQGEVKTKSIPTSLKKGGGADFGFIRFASEGNRLRITAEDPVARHFLLSDPNRIVIDFKRDKLFAAAEKTLASPPYLSVAVANHGKFARATVTLDGRYRYTLSRTGKTILIVCK